jgi:hypothetical protein
MAAGRSTSRSSGAAVPGPDRFLQRLRLGVHVVQTVEDDEVEEDVLIGSHDLSVGDVVVIDGDLEDVPRPSACAWTSCGHLERWRDLPPDRLHDVEVLVEDVLEHHALDADRFELA